MRGQIKLAIKLIYIELRQDLWPGQHVEAMW